MAYDNVVYEVKDGVATITLNRPDAYNALNIALARDLFHATLEADEGRDVRCIVITGAGRAFCAGGDVKDFADNPERIGILIKELTTYLHGTVSRLARAQKPVIMAVNGVAAGGGMSFALSGDLDRRGRVGEVHHGVFEDRRVPRRLVLVLSAPDDRAAPLAGAALHEPRALGGGGARVGPRDPRPSGRGIPGAVGALARELAQGPTLAFGRAKLLFHQSTQESLETQMELEAQAIAASGHTEDFRNGVLAFAKKQPVTFRGR